jgi:hypothetical protein
MEGPDHQYSPACWFAGPGTQNSCDYITITVVPSPTILIVASPTENSLKVFNGATPGQCSFGCSASAIPTCPSDSVRWTCEDITQTAEEWSADPPVGCSITLTLEGLPPHNSDFGSTWVHVDGCGKSDTNTFKLFFYEEATNNPGGQYPNWYYYWSETPADFGTHTYANPLPCGATSQMGITCFVDGAWRSYIGRDANETSAAGTWNNAEGIDFFANLCRHEERHRLDMIDLWGANSGIRPAEDIDGDFLRDAREQAIGAPFHAGGYDPALKATIADHFNYGAGWNDCEDYCLHREEAWNNGDADQQDWACPGHQWQ